MLFHRKIGIVLPAYNEAGFITKTLNNIPDYVDVIVPVDDGSQDSTYPEILRFARHDRRVIPVKKAKNGGIGSANKAGYPICFREKVDYIVMAPGDNQCDLSLIRKFVSVCEHDQVDVCRANRFLDSEALKNMPASRHWGNVFYSFLTKFVSGYYSMFDFLSSFSAVRSVKLRQVNLDLIRDDYLFDSSLWVALNIVNARIKEIPAPALYQGEKSDINYLSFVTKSFPYLIYAWFARIYYKYLYLPHPIGLFYLSGLSLFIFGLVFGIWVTVDTIGPKTASTATVMLSVVPFIVGFQLLLQAIVLDIQNEPK